ncbi:hypothetical protein D9757_008465 [Collybiopsis confluens]|uniref:Uncharacterized protein n=1 Tax=Collybiopsis confluens TaxID=2823264 RepID=A0A8H5HFH0_9AGAR|nr:hypothetical protein D9757_008465 [Collybiopsis confluens]
MPLRRGHTGHSKTVSNVAHALKRALGSTASNVEGNREHAQAVAPISYHTRTEPTYDGSSASTSSSSPSPSPSPSPTSFSEYLGTSPDSPPSHQCRNKNQNPAQ